MCAARQVRLGQCATDGKRLEPRAQFAAGSFVRRVRRSDGELPVLQRPDRRGDLENLRDVERVLDDDEREAVFLHKRAERRQDGLRLGVVKPRQRLVEEQHLRARADGADHRDELRLRDLGVRSEYGRPVGKAHLREDVGDLGGVSAFFATRLPCEEERLQRILAGLLRRGHRDVVRKRLRGEKADVLPGAPQRRRLVHGAAVGLQVAGEDVQERRLAGAVRALEENDFAAMQLEVDVRENGVAAEGLRQSFGLKHHFSVVRLHLFSSPCSRLRRLRA